VVDEQDYCDWCYGWLSDGDRRRSRALGLPLEASWACGRCLDAGRYRRPPDGWDGPVEEWLARNVFVFTDEELLALSQALNEMLHGPDAIPQSEFPTRIGTERPQVTALLNRILGNQ
jgi:hypothetical protein